MAAYYKVEVSLNTNSVTVGSPSAQEVLVTLPLVGPQGATGPAGTTDYNELSNTPATFAPSAHASSHHTGGGDALTAANIGAAKAATDIELIPNGTTTITTAQLPVRGIAFSDGETTFTVNLPTPDIRQSGLTFSVKSEYESGSGPNFITVVHAAVNLLTVVELDEDEGSIDFTWDGYAWVYDSAYRLRSFPGRVLQLPAGSGTIALTEPADDIFRVTGSADATKKVAFEVDGLTTATTRTITVPNTNVTLPNQGTSTGDSTTFAQVTINDTVNEQSTLTLSDENSPNKIEFATQELTLRHTGTNDTPYINVTDGTDYALLGVRQGDMFLQGGNAVVRIEQGGGNLADIKVNKLVLEDATTAGSPTATFDADGNLTDSRTYDLPDASGTLALNETFAAPPAIGNTTPAAGTFTTLSANNGTLTASAPVLDLAQTWNNAAVTFTGLKVNATDTASAAASLLADFQTGGTSRVRFTKAGAVSAVSGSFSGGMAVGAGSSLGPFSISFANNGSIYSYGTGFGAQPLYITMSGGVHVSAGRFSLGGGGGELEIYRDANNVLAQRLGTSAQTFRLYGTFTTATNYQRMTVRSVKTTLSALSGASATTTGTLIPDGAVVVGVTTRVATLLAGATGYQVGDGTDADRWGDINAIALNTTSDNANWTAGTIECFTSGGEVTLTANGSNFTGGAVVICVFYLAGEAD